MKKILAAAASLALIGSAAPAFAHGNTKPQHGGVVMMNGETLFELVAEPAGVSLYMMDDDEPMNASAMTANLSVTAAGARSDAEMVPMTGNQFFAKGLQLPAGANVGVQVADKASGNRYGTTFLIK